MPLGPPPRLAELELLPRWPVRGRTLHRIFRADRVTPWWFASVPSRASDPDQHGRFDLPSPDGACYLGLTAVAAVLETLPQFTGLLPEVELRARRRAQVRTPPTAPVAANLAVPAAHAAGATAALWAGADRRLTQTWAQQLRRAGWRALHHGISHDPSGRLRAVTLFDTAGAHLPYDEDGWQVVVHTLHDDELLHQGLRRFGITVAPSDPQLTVIPLGDAGLLGPLS